MWLLKNLTMKNYHQNIKKSVFSIFYFCASVLHTNDLEFSACTCFRLFVDFQVSWILSSMGTLKSHPSSWDWTVGFNLLLMLPTVTYLAKRFITLESIFLFRVWKFLDSHTSNLTCFTLESPDNTPNPKSHSIARACTLKIFKRKIKSVKYTRAFCVAANAVQT